MANNHKPGISNWINGRHKNNYTVITDNYKNQINPPIDIPSNEIVDKKIVEDIDNTNSKPKNKNNNG